jgi:protease I
LLVSTKSGTIQAMNHADKGALLKVDLTLADADPARFGALLIPGGVASPDALRTQPLAVAFVRSFVVRGKPIAAICHAPWLLIEAGAVRGKYVTSWPSLKSDLLNAGANWMDQPVVDDSGLVTSRKPEDIPEFSRRAVEEFSKI